MKEKRKKIVGWKTPRIFFFLFLFAMIILFIRYAQLSLVTNINGMNIKTFAANRNTVSMNLYAKRGTIYDIEGNILATDVSSYTVIAYLDENRTNNPKNPQHVVDKEKTARELAPILNMEEEQILDLLNKTTASGKTPYQVELGPGGRGITELTRIKIRDLNLPGIAFIETYKRFYPNGNFASYTIGYARQYEEVVVEDGIQKIEHSLIGELGLERGFNDLLTGKNGFLSYQKDRQGYKLPDTDEERIPAQNGANITLTIDSNVQRFLEAAIKNVVPEYGPEWMTLTVMDAKTGAILGTSSHPNFDPNIRDISNYQDPLVTNLYEPGSIMKTFTYMCAIDSGKYNGNDTILSGSMVIGPDRINDWNPLGWGRISYDLGYEYSSNIAAANLVQNVISRSELRECLANYGFGSKTGIELPREMQGSIKFTYPIEVATAAYGQGITTTAIQQIQALTLISNNGKMLQPYIIKKIEDEKGNIILENDKTESEQIIKTSTVEKMKELMYNAIYGGNPGTAASSYRMDGYELLGKTGTAQFANAHTGKYESGINSYTYSFAGMFPADDPQVIIFGSYKKPYWGGSQGLNRAVKEVISNIAKYLNIFDSVKLSNEVKEYKLSSYINKKTENILKELEGLDIVLLGDGNKVIKQFPSSGVTLVTKDKVMLLTNSNEIVMPDLTGYTRSECIALFDLLGVQYKISGNGKVVSQSLEKGVTIDRSKRINIELQ